jgi:pyridoxal phosphate enzyme (YggS family)
VERRAEIEGRLSEVRARIAAACADAGRDPGEITLVAVTKTYPAQDVVHLAELGVRDIGENRDREASAKAAAVAEQGAQVRWHFIGQLQRGKCRSVARYAEVVHSVDGVRLALALAEAARRERERTLDVLVQVSTDDDPARGGAFLGGAEPDRELDRVAAAVAGSDALRLAGVMAMAPLSWRPDDAFARLLEQAHRLRARYPDATVVSGGMSADLEAAITHGATHLRIGSALLGKRAVLG